MMSSSEIVLNSSSAATQVNFVEGRWTSDTIYDAVARHVRIPRAGSGKASSAHFSKAGTTAKVPLPQAGNKQVPILGAGTTAKVRFP